MMWLLFIGALVLIAVVRKKVKLPGTAGSLVVGVLIGFLMLVAGAAFFQLWPGQLTISAFSGFLGLFGLPVAAVASLLLLLATIVIVADVKDKQVDGPAASALFVVPGLGLMTGGPLAAFWTAVGTTAVTLATSGLSGIGG